MVNTRKGEADAGHTFTRIPHANCAVHVTRGQSTGLCHLINTQRRLVRRSLLKRMTCVSIPPPCPSMFNAPSKPN